MTAVTMSSPLAISSIVIAMTVAAVHEHEGEHREDDVVLDHLVVELHRHHGAGWMMRVSSRNACLNSTTALIILMPPPVEPELVEEARQEEHPARREHGPLRVVRGREPVVVAIETTLKTA